MTDQSYLDRKYFIDIEVFNCPFCNRNNVSYSIEATREFDWSESRKCFVVFARCNSCNNTSMHLSFEDITEYTNYRNHFKDNIDIDSKIFYSVPTSFFVIDNRIHEVIRELITEAEGCLKMNFLTGASACIRKAIYEFLVLEKTEEGHYKEKIKQLKAKYPNSDPELFDILGNIQEMTSDKIHEQSWDKWDSQNLKLITETLKTVLYDIYVIPKMKEDKINAIKALRSNIPIK